MKDPNLTHTIHPNGIRVFENLVPRSKDQLPLVFVHGMWGDPSVFKYWLNTGTQNGIKEFSIELRNHGEDKDLIALGKHSVDETYAADVSQVIDVIGECILVGWSMGGLICQLVAARNKKVKKLVIVTSAAPAYIPVRGKVMTVMPWYTSPMLKGLAFKLSDKHAIYMMANHGFDPYEKVQFLKMLNPESGTAAREMAFFQIKSEKITCPVLIISAEKDNITPVGMQLDIKKKLEKNGTKVTYEMIKGASHAVMIQADVRKPAFKKILHWTYGENYSVPPVQARMPVPV